MALSHEPSTTIPDQIIQHHYTVFGIGYDQSTRSNLIFITLHFKFSIVIIRRITEEKNKIRNNEM